MYFPYVVLLFSLCSLVWGVGCEQSSIRFDTEVLLDEAHPVCFQDLTPQIDPICAEGFLLRIDHENDTDYCCEAGVVLPGGDGSGGQGKIEYCQTPSSCPAFYDFVPGLLGPDCQLNECAIAGYDTHPFTGECTCSCEEDSIPAEVTTALPQCPELPGLAFLRYRVDVGVGNTDVCIYEDTQSSEIIKLSVASSMCLQGFLQIDAGQDVCQSNAICPEGMLLQPDGMCTVCGSLCSSTETKIYAHSSLGLYAVDPNTLEVHFVGNFTGDFNSPISERMTDIAVSKNDEVFGLSERRIFSIDPQTAETVVLADLSGSGFLNGMSFVPDPNNGDEEILVAVSRAGRVYRIHTQTGDRTVIGAYGSGIRSDGDIVYVEGVGIMATVILDSQATETALASIDPMTFNATVLGTTNHVTIWGIGFWGNTLYGFDGDGNILGIDPETGESWVIKSVDTTWNGAGVTTRACVSGPLTP